MDAGIFKAFTGNRKGPENLILLRNLGRTILIFQWKSLRTKSKWRIMANA